MNTTLARLGVAAACAAIMCAAALPPRATHADPGDNGGFGNYRPSDWDAVIAYLDAIAANQAAVPEDASPAPAAPPPAAAIEAPVPAAVPQATAAARAIVPIALPNAGTRDAGSTPRGFALVAAGGVVLVAAGIVRRRHIVRT
jgi:hypothetical protein